MAEPSDLAEWGYVPSLQRPLPAVATDFMLLVTKKQLNEKERFHLAQGGLMKGAAVFFLLYVWPLTALIPGTKSNYAGSGILEFLFLVVAIVVGLFTLNTCIIHKLRKSEATKIPVLGAMANRAKNSNFWFGVAYLSPFILFFAWLGLILLVFDFISPALCGSESCLLS